MAGKKDKVVIAKVSDLTVTQAANLTSEILKAKAKVAPKGKGTAIVTTRDNVGRFLMEEGPKKLEEGKE